MRFTQVLTYWQPSGTTDLFAKPFFNAPVLLKCIWQERTETSTLVGYQFLSKKGEQRLSKSKVFILQADIHLDGYVFLGDATAFPDPTVVPNAWMVQQVAKTPSLRSLRSLTTVYL